MIEINTCHKYAGYFRLHTTDAEGNITKDTGWFHNLITDSGLDFIGSGPNPIGGSSAGSRDFCSAVSIGIGNSTPAYSDTSLDSFLNSIVNWTTPSITYVSGAAPYWSAVRSWQFAAGTATGNIAELGTSPASAAGGNPMILFSRALVVDGGGSPTVIPVLSTEALTITYELRQYIDITDHSYSFDISGVTYSGTYRRANITLIPAIYRSFIQPDFSVNSTITVYNGSIAAITSAPSGSQYIQYGGSLGAYSTGTHTIARSNTIGINDGNLTGGITAFLTNGAPEGQWQFSVSPAIPKTNLYSLIMNWNISWARY